MSAGNDITAALADPAGLGRLLTRVENDVAYRAEVLRELPTSEQHAWRIGVTGSPGVGKSTLLGRLVPLLVGVAPARPSSTVSEDSEEPADSGRRDKYTAADIAYAEEGRAGATPTKPAILAVDPSSALTGGAVLADRFRWNELSAHGVFVRSLASRGSLGGTSAAAGAVLRVLEAAGYSPLLIETVGVGQTGFEVTALADTVVVLLSPESGDALQLLKAGLIESGDIFVVNKSDRPGAEALLTELRSALDGVNSDDWKPPVLSTVAETGVGVAELAANIAEHRVYVDALAPDHPLRLRRIAAEITYALRSATESALHDVLAAELSRIASSVQSGQLSLAEATAMLSALLSRELSR